MTQPALARQTPYGRMYSRSLGEEPTVPSITTVIAQQGADLGGWHGHMAATSLAAEPELAQALGDPSRLRTLIRQAAQAAERYRDDAAARGDRVHFYCEQVALRTMGRDHQVAQAREDLAAHNEQRFADRFDEWWAAFDVQPIAAEVTVWNHQLGYAGTLDLVARIGGRLCLIDYKTKGTDRDGFVKPLDDKVVMQLVAGMKAEESLVNAAEGLWEPWAHGGDPLLLGIAVGETEVRPMRANPAVLQDHWYRFCSLHRSWRTARAVGNADRALLPIGPPPAAAAAPAPQAAAPQTSAPQAAAPQTTASPA